MRGVRKLDLGIETLDEASEINQLLTNVQNSTYNAIEFGRFFEKCSVKRFQR